MGDRSLRVELVYALPQRYWCEQLELAAGATIADALVRTTLHAQLPGFSVDFGRIAVHGRLVALDTPLADGDRIELLRPLVSDPKEVRRRRAAQQQPKRPRR